MTRNASFTANPRPKTNTRFNQSSLILAGVATLSAIMVVSAIARLSLVADGLSYDVLPPSFEEGYFVRHWVVSVLHLLPGIIFCLLGPLQFSETLRSRWPRWHRFSGRLVVAAGLIVAVSALWMNQYFPAFGGILKYSSNALFAVLLALTLILAVKAIRNGDVSRHRVWMVRAFAIGLGVATQRVYRNPSASSVFPPG